MNEITVDLLQSVLDTGRADGYGYEFERKMLPKHAFFLTTSGEFVLVPLRLPGEPVRRFKLVEVEDE